MKIKLRKLKISYGKLIKISPNKFLLFKTKKGFLIDGFIYCLIKDRFYEIDPAKSTMSNYDMCKGCWRPIDNKLHEMFYLDESN